jgi:ABC-type multidrug transport system ATPase subunit
VPELIDSLADRVVVLSDGRVVYDRPREMVRRDGGMVAVFQRVVADDKEPGAPPRAGDAEGR